jgi:hypothetical protein
VAARVSFSSTSLPIHARSSPARTGPTEDRRFSALSAGSVMSRESMLPPALFSRRMETRTLAPSRVTLPFTSVPTPRAAATLSSRMRVWRNGSTPLRDTTLSALTARSWSMSVSVTPSPMARACGSRLSASK